MTDTPLSIVILAAGQGSRMKSKQPKVMHELANLPMLSWLIQTAEGLSPEKIIVVRGPDMDEVADEAYPYDSVIQETQKGTADAVKPALPLLDGFDGNVMVLMGDEPFVPAEGLQEMAAHDGMSVMGFHTADPSGLGRMVLNDDGTLQRIVEDKDCDDQQRMITLCNSGNYCIPAQHLKGWIEAIGCENAQGEYYLTDLPQIAAKDGFQTHVVQIDWHGSWGVNTKIQLAEHEVMIQDALRRQAMADGVMLIDPSSVYFAHDTSIDAGTIIEPNVFFGEGVSVGKNVHIKAFCHFEEAKIGDDVVIGPFARLRPGAELDDNVRIGNFVEVKNSLIGKGSKANHFGYIGDAEIGENVNFSCGAITVNYDGFEKHKTVIGDHVMVGSNVNLVAPVSVGDGAFIAAGSTISKDVPADALGIERGKPRIHDGWALNYRDSKGKKKDS